MSVMRSSAHNVTPRPHYMNMSWVSRQETEGRSQRPLFKTGSTSVSGPLDMFKPIYIYINIFYILHILYMTWGQFLAIFVSTKPDCCWDVRMFSSSVSVDESRWFWRELWKICSLKHLFYYGASKTLLMFVATDPVYWSRDDLNPHWVFVSKQ